MKASNFGDVGQMRRRNGISMKIIIGEHMLTGVSSASRVSAALHLQAYNGEQNQPVDEVGDYTGKPECKAQEDAQHSSPRSVSGVQVTVAVQLRAQSAARLPNRVCLPFVMYL
jgi:hypothetical protein